MSLLTQLAYLRPARYLSYSAPKTIQPSSQTASSDVIAAGGSSTTFSLQQNVIKVIADAVIEEHHMDESVITEHPVELGAVVTDHSYALPSELSLTYLWGAGSSANLGDTDSYLKKIYASLLALKNQPQLLNVYTGKRIYQNMLIESIAVETDRNTENMLSVRIGLKQVIFAQARIVQNAASATTEQGLPQQTTPTSNSGPQNLLPASTSSISVVS